MEALTDPDTWLGVEGFQVAEFVRNTAVSPQDLLGDGVLWFLRQVTVRVSLT